MDVQLRVAKHSDSNVVVDRKLSICSKEMCSNQTAKTQAVKIPPDDDPPPYPGTPAEQAMTAGPSTRDNMESTRPTTQYARDLLVMRDLLQQTMKPEDDIARRLEAMHDFDEIHETITSSLLETLAVLPNTAIIADGTAAEIMAFYKRE